MMELSQGENLISSEPGTKGFDLSAGNNWIYPLNYQFREYQFNIAKNALFNNTLVCLPTGLGKTLIAAVVMYNFWRWYPRGKIVFLAPTKPLVAQQIAACHDIMGIPSGDTIELTGTMNPKNRQVAWFKKRVIFATPQVFQNDLEKQIASGDMVRCVVIDEAHKALGKHSYCESIRLLQTQNKCFRVLALSATPGSKIEDVCQVMTNLLISNLELRDETSPDIVPYLNKRQMDIILVPLDNDLARFKEQYVLIMDRYIRLLVQYNVLKGTASTICKGRIFYLYKEFQSKTNKSGNYGQIMKTIGRCMSLYHAYELMIRHGLRAFTNFCQTHSTDMWMTDEPALQDLIRDIQTFLGPFPDIHPLPDGSVEEVPNNLVFGHTKFHKLRTLLLEHFEKFAAKNEETRAIVFVEYRDSVNEVYISLLQSRPTLRPKMFVGQAGQKRKQQMQAMDAFRNNEANVLISTSVGEEGLDVGEVDLIVCFDISQSSPIRLVQRMGRTGRRRDGRIVMLVTDGKEHQALKSTIAKKDSLNNKVLHSSNVVSALYHESPRMVPPDMNPVCSKRHIVLQPKTPVVKGKRKRKEIEEDCRMENEKKNVTVAKNNPAMPNEGEKPNAKPKQSSMLTFFKKAKPNQAPEKVLTCTAPISQENQTATQVAQTDSMKLFTSDAIAVEFLTLCAIKASKLDRVQDEFNRMDKTYLAKSSRHQTNEFFDFKVPDLDILNCIAFLKKPQKSLLPEVIEDEEDYQNDDDIYIPEFNRSNFEYEETSKPPADGKFQYEDLFEDSCESDDMALIDDQQFIMSVNNQQKVPQNEEDHKFQKYNEPKKEIEKLSLKKNEINSAALDQVSKANEQQCAKETSFSKTKCFESILDNSSDSGDIPTSPCELDLNIRTTTQRLSPKLSVKKDSEELLDDDDDVIFIGEIERITNVDESRKKSIDLQPNEENDDVVFEQEVSFREKTELNHSRADSNRSTITQILELIDHITPRRINLNKLSKNSSNSSKCNKSKLVDKPSSSNFETLSEDETINPESTVSHYFNQDNQKAKDVDVCSKADELAQNELDLSDVKWEDDFGIEETIPDDKVCRHPNEALNSKFKTNLLTKGEESFKTNSENSLIFLGNNSITEKRELYQLDKRKEPFKTNSETSTTAYESKIELKKSSPKKMTEFDLGDFEWDSDFEAPANPVESLKQFRNSKETSSIKLQHRSTSGLMGKHLSSKLRESNALSKKLSLEKSETSKPSTSKNNNNDDSDFEDDIFHKLGKKCKNGSDHRPTTNYVLTTNRSPVISKGRKWFLREQENADPNSRCINLSLFSASRKDSAARKVPFAREVTANRKEVSSLERYPSKRKNYQSRNRVKSEFLEYEAEISSDTSGGTSGDDDDLDGFVSHSQEVHETDDMHGHYLQSIKDVQQNPAFHFKESTTAVPVDEVFSQPASQDSSYLHDSFCVSGGEDDSLAKTHQDSLLETAERMLKNKKQKHSTNSRSSGVKRRRVLDRLSDSNSSEDETEKLRKQILDESLNLKRKKH